jgi:hypothetical protein
VSLLKKPRGLEPLDALADDFMTSYVCWREACEHVRASYDRWHACTPPQRALGFLGYRAALDREEQAARLHADQAAKLTISVLSSSISEGA